VEHGLARDGVSLFQRVGTGPQPAVDELVEHLLLAYSQPHRGYQDTSHLAEVLEHVDALAGHADDPDAVRLAAWFHDAVYDATGAPGADEEASAGLALHRLRALGVATARVAEVARLVRLTATHDPDEDDRDGAVLSDADLAVLARDQAGYAAYVAEVRREYAKVPEPAFRAGRAAVLRHLAAAPTLFRTPTGRARWEAAARANLEAELAELTRP